MATLIGTLPDGCYSTTRSAVISYSSTAANSETAINTGFTIAAVNVYNGTNSDIWIGIGTTVTIPSSGVISTTNIVPVPPSVSMNIPISQAAGTNQIVIHNTATATGTVYVNALG